MLTVQKVNKIAGLTILIRRIHILKCQRIKEKKKKCVSQGIKEKKKTVLKDEKEREKATF